MTKLKIITKTDKLTQNDPLKITQNRLKWHKMIYNDFKWQKGPKWIKWHKWLKMAKNDVKWLKMT